ncbi:MAG: Na/Pi symporter [Muribaculum sp.]|nr:Na/Pi symporter [Muribaculum sp.]
MLTMFGGLALFLYGMYLLEEGLSQTAGGRLERLLGKMTDTSWKAALTGAGVTALLQSSSAATVMVVGLVDSGMLGLSQAAGIIIGANIGTTVTAWILSLAGLEGNGVLLSLLQPSGLSALTAVAGVWLLWHTKEKDARGMGAKAKRQRSRAPVLIGFSQLLFGMDTMTKAVKPLASMPGFASLFTAFAHPLWGLLAGGIVTALLQSSSASVGILQALCATGTISYGTAIPIIMGQNIGTCATALLSAAGAGKNAKRAALLHLYFNGIGSALFLAGFYALHAVRPFEFLNRAADGVGIAAIHSGFNLAAAALLLPCSGQLVRLACLSVGSIDKAEVVR